MDSEPRLRLVLIAAIAGVVLGFILCGIIAFLLPPIPADAADVGLFTTSASGARTNCTQIVSPVAFATWCFDQGGAVEVWTGSAWATVTAVQTTQAFNSGTITASNGFFLGSTRTLWNGTPNSGVPTCSNNCGANPIVVGTNSAMRVTLGGSGTRNPFLILFNGAWSATPACIVQLDNGGINPNTATVSFAQTTTTGIQVNVTNGPTSGNVFSVICLGVQ